MKNQPSPMTYISLFSSAGVGCYGFSITGFDCIATVEIIERRIKIQKFNKKCRYESGYIADDITQESTKEKIRSEIKFWQTTHALKDVDVILATPPCQGMSVANHKKNNERSRNSLVVESIKLVAEVKPKFFVFENVRAFLTTECTDLDEKNKPIREAIDFNLSGLYNIHYQILNFKDYGCPTSRTRTLVIGVRKDIQEVAPLDLLPERTSNKTVRDVIGDLPPLTQMGEIWEKDIYHNFRPYAGHMRPWISNLSEGQSAFDNTNPTKKPHKIVKGQIIHNQNKNGDKYSRCFWDKVGPCIHTRNDILSSQSTIHPSDDRVFSVRELMRLMSIPDNFQWSATNEATLNQMEHELKKSFLKKEELTIRQSIGEAVPTIIFKQIAEKIKEMLEKPDLDDTRMKKIIQTQGLTNKVHLKKFLIKNLNNHTFSELSKITELSNAERLKHAAFYTRQDICYTIIKDLPDASLYEKISILEPAVGAGNFLPLLIKKYRSVGRVLIDVVDIDKEAIEILKILVKKLNIPKNITVNFIIADFLLLESSGDGRLKKRYDIIVGNPPFGSLTPNTQLLIAYKKNKFNQQSNNLFSLFLESCTNRGDIVGLIIPKSFLSAPEFNKTRELVSTFSLKKITDYGEKAFKAVKIETISLIIDTTKKGGQTRLESYVKKEIVVKNQNYICSNKFPYWLIYRDTFFDEIAQKIKFGVFLVFRDRQITKKITKTKGKIRVLKSRNIADNKILNIPRYDTYIDDTESLAVSKFLNKTNNVLVPNLTYYPRACFLPKNTIVDGSVAILTPKSEIKVTKKDLEYFNTDEFSKFYRVARNYGTRSLNIDSNSVFFLGLRK